MDHLIAGERSPKVLAQLARGKSRRRIGELERALEAAEFFTAEHAALLAAMLARIDRVSEEIARLTQVIEQLLAPYEEQLQQAAGSPPAATFPPGPAAPRWTTSPASATGKPNPRRATGTWAPSPARLPSRPAAPRPAKAPATGA
jgi:hypothetical protein